MLSRRKLIKRLSTVPLLGGLVGGVIPFESAIASTGPKVPAPRDLFKELGVRTFINAAGTLTYMTGSLMQDEVLETGHVRGP